MRLAHTNRAGHNGERSARPNGVEPGPGVALPRNGTSVATATSDVVTQILRSAVIEQYERDRNGFAEPPPEPVSTAAEAVERDDAKTSAIGAAVAERTPGSDGAIPVWKRVFDCTIIVLALPVWLPVMFLCMLAIKLSSPGPVLYRQERIGYRGRRFMIFKFRSMKVNVETRSHESYFERLMKSDSPMTKLDSNGDPRLIGCGRLLRAAGLDELPQLFNVLRGEMSLVGPRPCTVHEFERYLPWQRERVNAPPGLTGYWQVNGKNKTTFSEMISMDIFYSKNMSLALDLEILGKTFPAVLSQVQESNGVSGWRSLWGFLRSAAPARHD